MVVFVIKEIRKEKNMSLYELSQRTDISRTYLRMLENNKKSNPTLRILEDIAEALEVTPKDLFYSSFEVKNLKEELYKRIYKYGRTSKEALEISHIIDLLINVDMK